MDISPFIAELLYERDCVIIPGFGGFLGSYQAARIAIAEQVIYPPAKAISFNVHLKGNDGLLADYIASSQSISFNQASAIIETWVIAATGLLKRREALYLNNIGQLTTDIEGNLQFAPSNAVNYLKTSCGLKPVTAVPLLRSRPVLPSIKESQETSKIRRAPGFLRIAAAIILILGIGGSLAMIGLGIDIKPLNLDEANVLGFVERIFKDSLHELNPAKVVSYSTATLPTDTIALSTAIATPDSISNSTLTNNPVAESQAPKSAPSGGGYYIIIGAFSQQEHIEAARAEILKQFPATALYEDKSGKLTRLGYWAGNSYKDAVKELNTARETNSSYWLFKAGLSN
ncbi:MAG TPA: hypothetical protein VG603_03190 [Chitinophagales bacterium]|nr:hypothetical protein [Chitinophagales bacterium]